MGTKLYSDAKEDFGKRLQKLRKQKHYKTQADFATAMKVKEETIRNWEQGRVLPHMETMFKICKLLDCDLDYLSGRIDCTTHDIQYIHDKTGLSEEAIQKLNSFMSPPDYKKIKSDLRELGLSESEISKKLNNEHKRYDSSIQRYYSDIISLLLEDIDCDYLLSLITRRVKDYDPSFRPQSHSDLIQDDMWIDIDGQRILTHKKNMLDSLIQSEVSSMIPIIAEKYHSINSEL